MSPFRRLPPPSSRCRPPPPPRRRYTTLECSLRGNYFHHISHQTRSLRDSANSSAARVHRREPFVADQSCMMFTCPRCTAVETAALTIWFILATPRVDRIFWGEHGLISISKATRRELKRGVWRTWRACLSQDGLPVRRHRRLRSSDVHVSNQRALLLSQRQHGTVAGASPGCDRVCRGALLFGVGIGRRWSDVGVDRRPMRLSFNLFVHDR